MAGQAGKGRGRRGPTSHDVAARANVSQSTVSRALSGDPNVSEVTRQRVIAAAQALHYTADAGARSLITRRTDRVGVVLSNITNPFYPLLVERLDLELARLGYGMILFRHENAGDDALVAHVRSRSVDGLIFTSAVLGLSFADRLEDSEIPIVFLNREIDDDRFDRVVSDNVGGGKRAAELLVELGHERIALVSGPADTSTARDRDIGFLATLADRGRPLPSELTTSGPYSHETGADAFARFDQLPDPPTAIFCGNDVIALGVWDAAISAGRRIPQDLSVLGFDDIDMASWDAISLTTVRQPLPKMARTATEMLIERLDGSYEGPGRRRVFPTELIFRRTVGPPRR